MLNPKLFYLPHTEIQKHGVDNLTYGSLTPRGIESVVQALQQLDLPPIHGFDLGCGDGELIYHLQQQLEDSSWEGVEISEARVSMQTRDVTIWEGDMLDENLHPYNVLHADNLCLDRTILEKLEEKIANEFSGIYITYQKITSYALLKKAAFLFSIPTDATWGKHTIYYYKI